MALEVPRPRPRLASPKPSLAVTQSPQRKRIRTLGNLIGGAEKTVPDRLATGANQARKDALLKARQKAAGLDILAKRRTDEGER